jgi:hypothetical protein
MKRLALCLLAMTLPVAASAQDGIDPEVNLNFAPVVADFIAGCNAFADGSDCASITHDPVTDAAGAFVFLVASNQNGWVGDGGIGNGIGAIIFGIEYTGLTFNLWQVCAPGSDAQEVPQADTNGTWPESGTGNAIAWTGGCYDPAGENARLGYLYSVAGAASGSMQFTADPRDGAGPAAYTDCDAFTWEIVGLNGMDLDTGSAPNCNPAVPTEEKSWSQIKSMF